MKFMFEWQEQYLTSVCLTGSETISVYAAGTASNFFLILKAKRVNLKML